MPENQGLSTGKSTEKRSKGKRATSNRRREHEDEPKQEQAEHYHFHKQLARVLRTTQDRKKKAKEKHKGKNNIGDQRAREHVSIRTGINKSAFNPFNVKQLDTRKNYKAYSSALSHSCPPPPAFENASKRHAHPTPPQKKRLQQEYSPYVWQD